MEAHLHQARAGGQSSSTFSPAPELIMTSQAGNPRAGLAKSQPVSSGNAQLPPGACRNHVPGRSASMSSASAREQSARSDPPRFKAELAEQSAVLNLVPVATRCQQGRSQEVTLVVRAKPSGKVTSARSTVHDGPPTPPPISISQDGIISFQWGSPTPARQVVHQSRG